MTDEIDISSLFGQGDTLGSAGGQHGSASGRYGAQQEADRGAGLGFEVLALFQALGDKDRMGEDAPAIA